MAGQRSQARRARGVGRGGEVVTNAYRQRAVTAITSRGRAASALARSLPAAPRSKTRPRDRGLVHEATAPMSWSRLTPTPDEVMSLTLELLAHELRSPLSASRRAVDLLLQRRADNDQQLLAVLAEALHRVARLVDDSLGLGQLERATGRGRIRVQELIESCITASSCPERLDVMTVPSEFEGDAGLLKPSIVCLIENALRHSRHEVLVSAGPVDAGTLVMVDDDGPGIPPALRELVFRPLVRLDPDAGEGAGLGLALVRRVAELHGGRVWAEEAAIGGARFCLLLP